MGSSSSRGSNEPIEPNSTMDSDNVDENSSASEYERSAEDLISVFQILIRNGHIHIMSSGEDDSEDGAYSPRTRSPKAPRIQHHPDTSSIQENDLHVKLSRQRNQPRGLTQLLAARELGGTFEGPEQKSNFSSYFLPNSIKRIANFGHKAFCGSYSKSGDVFLCAAQDRNIRIYETGGGRFSLIKQIQARDVGWSVLDTDFSPDGRHFVYSSWSECIHMVSIYGETERQESLCLCPDNRRFAIFSLVFSDDGVEILGGANDGYLYIYNRESNERVLKIAGHEDDVNSVSFADESSHILYSAADDGLCKVWDRRTLSENDPRPVGIFAGHIDGITYVQGKRDGRYLLTNSKDQSIKLWDMRLFSSDQAVRNTRRAVIEQSWDYRWQRVPKRLCIERRPFEGDTAVMTYRGHSVLNTLIRAKFSPAATTEQRYIYTGCAAGRVVIYDLLTGEIVKILKGHKACVRDVSWHPHRAEIVSTSNIFQILGACRSEDLQILGRFFGIGDLFRKILIGITCCQAIFAKHVAKSEFGKIFTGINVYPGHFKSGTIVWACGRTKDAITLIPMKRLSAASNLMREIVRPVVPLDLQRKNGKEIMHHKPYKHAHEIFNRAVFTFTT